MGKTFEKQSSPLKRNNVRVDPSTLAHYLCYYCGKMSSDRLEYQQHMLKVHEVMSQSYQLWSDQMMDTLGLRWSETKRPDEEIPSSYPPSPKSVASKTKDSDDDDEDYIYEEEERPLKKRKNEEYSKRGRKRISEKQKRDDFKKKAEADARRRKRAEERRREEKARRDEERRKAEEERKALDFQKEQEKAQAAAAAAAVALTVKPCIVKEVSEDDHRVEPKDGERKRRRRESKKKEESDEIEKTEVSELVKRIFIETKRKEASSQEVEDETVDLNDEERNRKPLPSNVRTTKYCKVCKKGTHYTFLSLLEHYIDHHHAALQSFNYYGFNGRTLVGKKRLLERKYCQRCLVNFESSKEYFTHMVDNHMFESISRQLGFEHANNADVEAAFSFKDRLLTIGFNFKFDQNGELPPEPSESPIHEEENSRSSMPREKSEEPSTSTAMDHIKTEPA